MRYSIWALMSVICLGFYGQMLAAQELPSVVVKNIAGQEITWPQELPAQKTVVILAYKRAQQEDVEGWIERLGFGSDGPYVQVLMLGRGARLARGFIDGGLRSAFDAQQQQRTFTVYVDAKVLNAPLQVADTNSVSVFVIDRKGRVLAREAGAPNAARVAKIKKVM